MLLTLLIVGFTGIALIGVRESVGLAAAVGAIEIVGLLAAATAGFVAAPDFDLSGTIPRSADAWSGAMAGAFIAFSAFLGFETLANMGEDLLDSARALP